jgi:hypothetical protein
MREGEPADREAEDRMERPGGGLEGACAGVAAAPFRPVEPLPLLLDETALASGYTNFVRVTGTPEEVILDIGFNKQARSDEPGSVAVTRRIVLSFYTAKRLFQALGMSLQRHEQAFGPIETNVQKRVVGQQQPPRSNT